MAAVIRAVVFKTTQLEASRQFFETVLHLPIKETSARHFVVHTKGVRIVFLQSADDVSTEFYINDPVNAPTGSAAKNLEKSTDPNGIRFIRVHDPAKPNQ